MASLKKVYLFLLEISNVEFYVFPIGYKSLLDWNSSQHVQSLLRSRTSSANFAGTRSDSRRLPAGSGSATDGTSSTAENPTLR